MTKYSWENMPIIYSKSENPDFNNSTSLGIRLHKQKMTHLQDKTAFKSPQTTVKPPAFP